MQPLLGGPRATLNADDVLEALSFRRGATLRRGVDVLTYEDEPTGEKLPFTGGSVTWAYRPPSTTAGQTSGVTATRRQASLVLAGPVRVPLVARRLRLWTDLLLRTGDWARFHHGVFEVANPGRTDDGVVVARTLALAGKSYRWATTVLAEPLSFPGTTVAVAEVKARMTSVFGETQFAIESSDATIGQDRTFEAGTSWLDVLSSLLQAVGFDQLTDDEDGRPASRSLAALAGQGIEATYGADQGKIVTAGTVDPLEPTLPNVLRFSARQGPSLGNTEGNGLTTRRNQSTGPASIDARGGTGVGEVELRVEVDVDNQAALEAVADAEQQRYFAGGGERFTGDVGVNLLAGDRDVIGLVLPRLEVASGAWLVTQWAMPFGPIRQPSDVLMRVTAERRVA